MQHDAKHNSNGELSNGLTGHALRNMHLRERALVRAQEAPPLASAIVRIRAGTLKMTRLEFARRSGISRGTMRDLELGVHTPTRHTLRQFVTFCQRRDVSAELLEEVRRLYTGPGGSLDQFIARLELRAGSPRELARRVGISPTTLWQYRRGNFPLPLPLLRQLCKVVNDDSAPAEELWHLSERHRLLEKGYPEAWAEFCVLCARAGHTESHLPALGLRTAALRRLRYLELPPWEEVAAVARAICQDDRELQELKKLWVRDEREQHQRSLDGFGLRLKRLRERKRIARRELADLFGIGGKKPARIIKYIEEDGFYSVQAYPAGLAALLVEESADQTRLLELWKRRRRQFHRRRRPEMRTDLRLAREMFGFKLPDIEPILGYSSAEYQKIERGVEPLPDSARTRILQAIDEAGRRRLEDLLKLRGVREAERTAWQCPPTVPALITLLARREGGLVPLTRFLTKAGVRHISPSRLRAIAHEKEVPTWHFLQQVGEAARVADMGDVQQDWVQRFRVVMDAQYESPLGVELRLLIAEVAPTLRAFSPRLGFNYSVLVRDLHRIDRDEPLRWFHVERILVAAGVPVDCDRWKEIRALWYTAGARKKIAMPSPLRRLSNGQAGKASVG